MAIKADTKSSQTNNINDESNIVDIDLTEIQKKKFRLDRDSSRVIELNTSDLLLGARLQEVYPKMLKMVNDANTMLVNESEDVDEIDALISINDKLKELLNYLFDSDIADKACPSGSLYDPINGKFRFEYIIEKLLKLYENNFEQEFKMMRQRVNKHTGKYVNKKRK